MTLILDDFIVIKYRVVIFPDKKIIAEYPDPVGMMGQGNFAQEDTIRAENFELVDILLHDLGLSPTSDLTTEEPKALSSLVNWRRNVMTQIRSLPSAAIP
jgi:hypothetical protein